MKSYLKTALSFVLALTMTACMVLLPVTQSAFAEGSAAASSEQLVEQEGPELPVGGWTPPTVDRVPNDFEVVKDHSEKKSLRSAKNGDIDEVFIKGASRVGYNSLDSEDMKAFYNAIDEAITDFVMSGRDIEPSEYNKYIVAEVNYKQFGDLGFYGATVAFDAYDYDQPTYYWLSSNLSSNDTSLYILTEQDYASASVRREIDEMVCSGVREYARIAESGTDTLDKIAIIHDKIENEISYARKNGVSVKEKWAHGVHGAFDPAHKQGVCEGYADTFALMMNYLGIPNYYIVGYANPDPVNDPRGGGGHAWNAVSADGGQTYLYMDLTWDDNGVYGFDYQYFGMPASDFERTHFKSNPQAEYDAHWLYEINEEFTNRFEDTYYYAGGFYYDGSTDVKALVSAAFAKAARAGDFMTFLAPDSEKLQELMLEVGQRLSIGPYRMTYKGTEYYYMIASLGLNHVHDWDEPEYEWTDDNSYVTASRFCWALFCPGETERETVATTEVVTKEPTCTEYGMAIYTAEFTNEAFETQTREGSIAALGHAWNSSYTVDKPATYTAAGTKSIHCAVCGDIKPGSEVTIPKVDLPKVTILAPVAAKKAATVKWKKVSATNQKKISGIQIQYSQDKNFKKGVKTTTAKKTAVSKKITKLTSKKKYYIRIRTYKKSGGETHASKWSKVKYVKVK